MNRTSSSKSRLLASLAILGLAGQAGASVWNNATSGGNWSDNTATGWNVTGVPNSTAAIADFSTLDLTADNTVHLNGSYTVNKLMFADTVGTSGWILDNNASALNILTLGGVTPTIQTTVATTISAYVKGTAGLIKTGAGTLTLSGVNTYTGTTTVQDGTLTVGSASSLFTGAIIVSATATTPVLDLGGFSFAVGAVDVGLNAVIGSKGSIINGTLTSGTYRVVAGSISAVLAGTGGFSKYNSGTVVLSGLNTYSGKTAILKEIVSINSIHNADGVTPSALGAPASANGTINMGAGGANTGILQYTGPATTTDRAINMVGTASGGGGIEANGSGALVFSSGVGSTITGTSTRNFTLSGTSTAANEIQGVISEFSTSSKTALVKSGVGTWVVSGNNTYSGGTTVSGGTLIVNNTAGSGTGSGAVTVSSGATLMGSGSMSSSLGGGGLISPGNSPGILTATSVDPSLGTDFAFEFTNVGSPTYSAVAASKNDVLHLTGATPFAAPLGAANGVSIYFNAGALSQGQTFNGGFYADNVVDATALRNSVDGGTFAFYVADVDGDVEFNTVKYFTLADYNTKYVTAWTVEKGATDETADFASGTINGYTTTLTVVPEPATAGILLIGMAAMALRRRTLHG